MVGKCASLIRTPSYCCAHFVDCWLFFKVTVYTKYKHCRMALWKGRGQQWLRCSSQPITATKWHHKLNRSGAEFVVSSRKTNLALITWYVEPLSETKLSELCDCALLMYQLWVALRHIFLQSLFTSRRGLFLYTAFFFLKGFVGVPVDLPESNLASEKGEELHC